MAQTSQMLEDLEFLKTKVKTLLKRNPALLYQAVRDNLLLYRKQLDKIQLEFKKELRQLLPQIRGKINGKSESDLLSILIRYKSSPFEKYKSLVFLQNLEREMKAIEYLTNGIRVQKNFIIADYKHANDVNLLINYRRVTIFAVNILSDSRFTKDFLENKKTNDSNFWYDHNPSVGLLGRQKTLFDNFANANRDSSHYAFLVKITKRKDSPFAISAQFDGVRDPSPFVTPDIPEKSTLVSTTHNSFTIQVSRPLNDTSNAPQSFNNWVKSFTVFFWKLQDGSNFGKKKNFVFETKSNITKAVIDTLDPITTYQFRIGLRTEYGMSQNSSITDVTTTPCSPPINLKLQNSSEDTLLLSWDQPIAVGTNITIKGYKATIYGL